MLQGAQHAQRVVPVTFEGKHRVHHVLQRAGTGERAVLGHVSHQHRRHVAILRHPDEPLRTLTHLAHRAGDAADFRIEHRLDRIDGQDIGADLGDMVEHDGQGSLTDDQQVRVQRVEASGRSRTCSTDSSAQTSRHVAPVAAIRPSAWSSSVLLPIPGSPPSRVTEPATSPPPSTRSSSGTPVGRLDAAVGSTAASAMTGAGVVASGSPLTPGPPERCSTRLDHAPHSGQRPSHFGAWASHSAQQ